MLKPLMNAIYFFFCLGLAGCATRPSVVLTPSHSLAIDEKNFLAQQSKKIRASSEHRSGAYPLYTGEAALLARLALIDKAETSIDLQVYLFHSDDTGNTLAHHIYQAAERGVRVRMLLDDNEKRDDVLMASIVAHKNIEIRLFNAKIHRRIRALSFITDFKHSNRRMHNKSMIVDHSFAVIGGRNIGDEYFDAGEGTNFADYDLLLLGDVIDDAANVFDLFWNSSRVTPIDDLIKILPLPDQGIISKWVEAEKQLARSGYYRTDSSTQFINDMADGKLGFFWGPLTLHSDDPSKGAGEASGEGLLKTWIGRHLATAKNQFLLVSPYFVPTNQGTKTLSNAAARGIDITVITNSLSSNDVFAVHGKYAQQRKKLLEANIKLYELKADPDKKRKRTSVGKSSSSLHAKTWVIDSENLFVGSFNFDPRSADLNTEMGVILSNKELASLMVNDIEETLLNDYVYHVELDENGKLKWTDLADGTQYHKEPKASIWLRMGAWFVGIFPVEGLL